MEPLIYYPTFEPPTDAWLKFSLLYFENFRPRKNIGTLVIVFFFERTIFQIVQALEGRIHNSFHDFAKDYYSRIWITYRTGMPPFEGTEVIMKFCIFIQFFKVTTDCGWGCMLRSAQMMIAQAICKGRLTRSMVDRFIFHLNFFRLEVSRP